MKRLTAVLVLAAVAAATALVAFHTNEPTRRIVAHFDRTVGLYPGSDVRVLGVKIGEVLSIRPAGDDVRVEMRYAARHRIPADVQAVLIPPTIVSDRYVQLTPAYTGGQTLADGADLPVSRTAAPLETDEVFRALNDFLAALGPGGANASGAFSDMLRTGRENLAGNGENLRATIDGLAKVAATLADGHEDLFTTLVNLQEFTTLLARSDEQLRGLNARLAEVAGQLSADRQELASMLARLATALGDVTTFVAQNRASLKSNVEALADVTGILARQQQALIQILDNAPLTLSNLLLAYNPQTGNLDLRVHLVISPAGVASEDRTMAGLLPGGGP
jgi:virulence factor Mce-like protein